MIESAKRHIYHGNGKGKTTAAVGLCARAANYGNNILFCSFLKDNTSGEIASLQQIGVDTGCVASPRFTWQLTADELISLKDNVNGFFEKIENMANDYNLIVLDEVLDAINEGLLEEDKLIRLLSSFPNTEIVITGRDPSETLISMADYVTEMQMQKHPFTDNLPARNGIEK